MESVRAKSFARAGLLGNPSDGYFGKTLSFAFANFGVFAISFTPYFPLSGAVRKLP